MPATPINYTGIGDNIKTTIEADASLGVAGTNYRVFVEEEPQFGAMDMTVIAIFLKKRAAAPGHQQRLAASQRIRMHLTYSVYVIAFSIESYKVACDVRNNMLGLLELVFMRNASNIGGSNENSWIEGGVTLSAKDSQTGTFISAGEIELTVSSTGTTQ